MSSPFQAVSTYFLAKDGNRPFLMRRAFAEGAELKVVVNTDVISFPGSARGLNAIEDILGRRFANDFENVYTFCLSRPSSSDRHHFPCHWLVGMSGKNNGPIRVGCGRYDWFFTPDEQCLVERLVITIDEMQVFPEPNLNALMGWLTGIPYPWCTPHEALSSLPTIDGLDVIETYLKEVGRLQPKMQVAL
jgi:hypothetical protein